MGPVSGIVRMKRIGSGVGLGCVMAARLWAQTPESAPHSALSTLEHIFNVFVTIWRYELMRIGGQPVQVNQFFAAIGVFVVGLYVSRGLTRLLRNRLLTHVKMDASAASALEKIAFYVLVAMTILFAFQVVQIPIGVFAFLGGALAIGLGFGAQNIVANFISGLILMIERPIRIGDLVEVDVHSGRVEDIRFRCTRIRRRDGIDVLVPNSSFLDKNVINWTLSDRQIRTSVTVGVAYGSPTDIVARLIRQAADEHPRVSKTPEPLVEFKDFGDNALAFQTHFWVEVETLMDLRIICSDIRFRIDQLFRESGVVIAFPQRDVHLDTLSPLSVRLVPPEKQGSQVS